MMKYGKSLPIAVISLALAGGVAATSFAQVATPKSETAQMAQQGQERGEMRPGYRGDGKCDGRRHEARGERGEREWGHRGKQGRRGGQGFGGRRSGSEIFMNLFNQADADNNKELTQDEINTFRAAKVGEADASGDGSLSIEEFDTLYREFTRSRMVDLFQDLDADGDGNITPAELDDRLGSIVDRMDRDGDGVLKLQNRGRRG